ncbi:PID-CTERM protein-sorting domain-containing protein [Winogradskyella sp. PC D3.3]
MFASVLVFFVGFASMAQGSAGAPPPPAPPPPPGLPIDGGIIVLFTLALFYGIYKSYKISKQKV